MGEGGRRGGEGARTRAAVEARAKRICGIFIAVRVNVSSGG